MAPLLLAVFPFFFGLIILLAAWGEDRPWYLRLIGAPFLGMAIMAMGVGLLLAVPALGIKRLVAWCAMASACPGCGERRWRVASLGMTVFWRTFFP